jgi:hypothetical protein
VPLASITASVSRAYSVSANAAGSSERSERPLPRGSNTTTRKWRAKYGTCAFQTRECTIAHGGTNTTVGSPSPKRSQ